MDLIDSLVRYVKEIKPYHTKIYGVDVEYRAFEDMNVSFTENLEMNTWLGVPLRDMSTFGWTLDDLNYPEDINLTPFLRSRGCVINPQSLWDNNFPSNEDLAGGIAVTNTTPTSFILTDDFSHIFDRVGTFDVGDANGDIMGINSGTFTVDQVTYNSTSNTTEVIVLEPLTPDITSNRILLSDWDSTTWDTSLLIDEQCFRDSGLMYENVYVGMSETISFQLDKISIDNDDCAVVIGHPWDQYIDGIEVIAYTATAIIMAGDVTGVMNVIPSFEIIDSDLNDGTYGVVSSVYDSNTNTTSVTVTVGPDTNGSGGKAKISDWDLVEWDGDSFYYDNEPPADFCAKTCFNESLLILDGGANGVGLTWDELLNPSPTNEGGWDYGSWDPLVLVDDRYVSCDEPPTAPPSGNKTSDMYWDSDPQNSIPYSWDDIEGRWAHTATDSVWEFALTPSDALLWSQSFRAGVLRIQMDPGPDEGNGGFLFGNVFLYDVGGNIVGSQPFNFANYNDTITVDIPINNAADLDYERLVFETFLYTTGPRIYLIEFDPE